MKNEIELPSVKMQTTQEINAPGHSLEARAFKTYVIVQYFLSGLVPELSKIKITKQQNAYFDRGM